VLYGYVEAIAFSIFIVSSMMSLVLLSFVFVQFLQAFKAATKPQHNSLGGVVIVLFLCFPAYAAKSTPLSSAA
jgi:hypothetical protein